MRHFFDRLRLAHHQKRLARSGILGHGFTSTRLTRFINWTERDRINIGNFVSLLDDELTCYEHGRITIGDHSWMSLRGQIIACRQVSIGRFCIIARDVYISDTNEHPVDASARREQTINYLERGTPPNRYEADAAPISIGDDVWIGERAIILKGVTIGDRSIVAAGAVVTRPVPADTIVAGNPARPVKRLLDRSDNSKVCQ